MQEARRIGWCLSSKTFVDPGQVTKLPVDDVKGKDHPYRKEDGVRMKTYTVYRVDYHTNKQELIGKVMERRREERSNNAAGMLQLAKKYTQLRRLIRTYSSSMRVPLGGLYSGAHKPSLDGCGTDY